MVDRNDDIEKYLAGDLSPDEMHALEKKVLRDPFLSDALEGASSVSQENFNSDLSALNQRLKNRESRKSWLSPLRIAAGIVLLVGASFIVYNILENEPAQIAETSPKKMTKAPSKSNPDSTAVLDKGVQKEDPKQKLLTLNQPAVAPRKEPLRPSTTTIAAAKPETVIGEEKVASRQTVNKEIVQESKAAETEADKVPSLADAHEVKKEEARAKSKSGDVANLDVARSASATGAAAPSTSRQKMISGKVTSLEDGSPIPGANIQFQGTNQGTVSDVDGNYQVVAIAAQDSLVISSLGYATREVKIPSDDSKVNISLPVDATQLNEVVVVGYGASDRVNDDEIPIQLAEPVGGKRAYNKYLETQLQYPQAAITQKIEGRVTIEFSVGTAGDLSEFKVLRGIGYGCNEEVIRLVKDGPEWKPSSQGKVKLESTVRVRVKFKLPK